jgi:hypothetical protein
MLPAELENYRRGEQIAVSIRHGKLANCVIYCVEPSRHAIYTLRKGAAPMSERRVFNGRGVGILAAFLVLAVVLVYLPLGLAGIESVLLKSHYVEDGCRYIGIYDGLDAIYDNTIFRIIK